MKTKKERNQPILLTAPLSSKAQITLPKVVRDLLKIHSHGDLVGFLLDTETQTVRLTKVDQLPVDPEFTEDECKKLIALTRASGGKKVDSFEKLIKDIYAP